MRLLQLIACTTIAFAPVVSFSETLSSSDEYLELLEIEITEQVCADANFRRTTGVSRAACPQQVLHALPECTKSLHGLAPKLGADSGRLGRDAFVQQYMECVQTQLRP